MDCSGADPILGWWVNQIFKFYVQLYFQAFFLYLMKCPVFLNNWGRGLKKWDKKWSGGGGGGAVHQGRVRLSLIALFTSCKIRFLGLDQYYYLALIVQFKVMHYIMITKEKYLSCVTLDRKVSGSSPIVVTSVWTYTSGATKLVDHMSGGVQNCLRASLFFVMFLIQRPTH